MSLITEVDILDESKKCFLTYAEEVLTERAVPAVEDGLLSSQRKILWTIEDFLKMNSKSKTKKCNSIVGSTLMTSYFHGDSSCYGVLCKLAQKYLMRYPLIEGQGMLGTQADNDVVASSRYTESKPSIYADLMMKDFDKNIVLLKETYNGEYMEPVVLPGIFPNAICNGRQSIGVSLAVNTPPNNLTEVCNALIALLRKGDLTLDEIISYIPGPDFPLVNTVLNKNDVREAYRTGKSKVSLKIRGEYNIAGQKITFTTIPYRVYRNKIKQQIEDNIDVLEKYIEDFDDESNIGENKLIFTVKKGVSPQAALEKLFDLTDLQSTFSYNMNFIVNGTPKLCSMKDLLENYLVHQENCLIKATIFDKEKAEARVHILEGIAKAVDDIDAVIKFIKTAPSSTEAIEGLKGLLQIDDVQAKAILDIKLGRLTKISKDELVSELEEKRAFLVECAQILNNKEHRKEILIKKITWLRDKYGDARRTKLEQVDLSKKEEEYIIPEDCVVVIDNEACAKRVSTKSYKIQKPNAVGVKNGQIIRKTIRTNTTDNLMVFSSLGKAYKIKVNDLPQGSKGESLYSKIKLAAGEKPMAYAASNSAKTSDYVFFVTAGGIVKKVPFSEYSTIRKTGVLAIKLKENDYVASVTFVSEQDEVFLVSKNGYIIRLKIADLPQSSRTATGVIGMRLNEGDKILTAFPANTKEIVVVTEAGKGKRVATKEFSSQGRGGKGVILSKEKVAGVVSVEDGSSILITGDKTSLSTSAGSLPLSSRTAVGNNMIKGNMKVETIICF